MDKEKLLQLFDREMRMEIEFPDQRKEANQHLVRFVRMGAGMNFVLYSNLESFNADAVISEQVRYFGEMGKSFAWKIYQHDSFPELKEHLLEHGFITDLPYPVMVLDVHAVSEVLKMPIAADVRRLVWPEQLDEVAQVEEKVWGGDFTWLHNRMAGWLAWPGYLSVYVGYILNQPACAGWNVFQPDSQFVSLFGGSTLEEYRGQGLYTAVLAARVQEAMQRGRSYLLLEPSEMSQPIVSKHGFEILTYCQEFVWDFPQNS